MKKALDSALPRINQLERSQLIQGIARFTLQRAFDKNIRAHNSQSDFEVIYFIQPYPRGTKNQPLPREKSV